MIWDGWKPSASPGSSLQDFLSAKDTRGQLPRHTLATEELGKQISAAPLWGQDGSFQMAHSSSQGPTEFSPEQRPFGCWW